MRTIRYYVLLPIVIAACAAGAVRQTRPSLGINTSLHGRRPFPPDNPWNMPIDKEPVDPNSAALVNSIGVTGRLHPDFGSNPNDGIPYIVVAGYAPKVPIVFEAADESDPGPYPVPKNAPIEGGQG